MDQLTNARPELQATPRSSETWWVIRGGRGRVGGSTFLDFIIQRSRRRGRRVKPLDGDLRSRTLSALYPTSDMAGAPMADGASSPASEDLAANKDWLTGELDASVDDGACRVVDFGGGDRVIQEYGSDLRLGDFCRDVGLGLIWAFVLGPDLEDLQHVVQVVGSGHVTGRILLVSNEGVIRYGQSTSGVFQLTAARPEYKDLLRSGAEAFLMPPRMTGMPIFSAAAAVLAVGSMPRQGMPAATKFFSK